MKEELKFFFKEIDKKHPSIKLKKYSKSKIEFFKILVYKDEKQKLQSTIVKKKTDRQSYIHAKSDHPVSL